MLLEALVACAGVTLRAVATSLGIDVRGGRVYADGDLDFRGTLAVDREAPVGFRDIRLRFELDTDATEGQLASLLKLTERYCVVYQTGQRPGSTSRSARGSDGLERTEGPPSGGPPDLDLNRRRSVRDVGLPLRVEGRVGLPELG
jgi:hypothetical protein